MVDKLDNSCDLAINQITNILMICAFASARMGSGRGRENGARSTLYRRRVCIMY